MKQEKLLKIVKNLYRFLIFFDSLVDTLQQKKKYKVLRLEERPSGKIKKIRLGTLDSENDARKVVFELLDETPGERLIDYRKLKWYLVRKSSPQKRIMMWFCQVRRCTKPKSYHKSSSINTPRKYSRRIL